MIANSDNIEKELLELKQYILAEKLHKNPNGSFAIAKNYNEYLVLKNEKNKKK